MTHPRKEIRDAVVGILQSASIVGAGKVYSNRALGVDVSDLPVLNVTTSAEASEVSDLGVPTLLRELTLTVEAVAKNNNDESIDDTLDDLAEDIETAMALDETLGGKAMDSYLSGTEGEIESDGETNVAHLRLNFLVRYEG